MAFCVQCGKPVGDADQFCSGCGHRQGSAPGPSPAQNPADFWNNLPDRTVMQLCYIPWVGWIPAVAVIAGDRFKTADSVRFHAFQGLYLFVAWLIADWFLDPMMGFGMMNAGRWFGGPGFIPPLVKLVVLIGWIFMLIKVRQGIDYRLPLVGDLADKSVAEQR